jgi:CcmD family protein
MRKAFMENLSYLFAAYTTIFAAVVLYVMFLWRRQARLDSRLGGLEIQLNEVRDALSGHQHHSLTTTPR